MKKVWQMQARAVRLFDIFGFQIKVEPSWILIAVLIVWSLSSSFFPDALPGLGQLDYIALSIIAMLGLFACLILHELAHSLVARRFGLGVGGITLFIFGGVAELEHEPADARSEFWIAIAGPLMSFALAGIAYLTSRLTVGADLSAPLQVVLNYLTLINLVLAFFNLLPAFPLDGGRVFRAALWHWYGDLTRATRIASNFGVGFAYCLMALGFLTLFSGGKISGLWQILIGIFLLTAARTAYQQVIFKAAFSGKTVADLMAPTPWSVAPEETLSNLVEKILLHHAVSFVPVCEGEHLLGYVDSGILQKIDREHWPDTQVADVFVAADSTNTVSPGMPTENLMKQIVETGRRKFLVSRNSQLLGVITLSDLLSYIAILQELGGPTKPKKQ